MPLESTMLCLDNSDWMRNGDYLPSRLEAQHDAAGVLCNDRINNNPENTVGILTMAGQGVDLLVSPTEESGKVLGAFAHIRLGGKSEFTTALQVAQLALKHRKNKNAAQRIVAFVGSPIIETTEALQKLGKQLKKNNVAVDIVSIGETQENTNKLQEFINAVNSGENSHFITVPAGVSPTNALRTSNILYSSTGGRGVAGGQLGLDEGGDMYEMDPEMAMALRVSAEEDRARQEAVLRATQEQSAGEAGVIPGAAAAGVGFLGNEEENEEALMQRALELSLRESAGSSGGSNSMDVVPQESQEAAAAVEQEDEDDEEAALQRALALSMNETAPTSSSTNASSSSSSAVGNAEGFADPEFVRQMLGTSDLSDPLVQAALAQLQSSSANNTNNSSGGGEEQEKEVKKRRNEDR